MFHLVQQNKFYIVIVKDSRWIEIIPWKVRTNDFYIILFAGLLRPLETVSKTSHKFDVNVFNNRKIHKVFAQSRSIYLSVQ